MRLSTNAKLPQADVTNAEYLFGDPDYGDFEDEGDPDNLYGDTDNLYGDVDPLSVYSQISGDIEDGDYEVGGLNLRRAAQGIGRFVKKHKKGFLIGGGIAGAAGLSALIAKKVRAKNARKRMVQNQLANAQRFQTVRNASVIQSNLGKLNKQSLLRFFHLKGAKMNSSPIVPLSTYVADMLKVLLDRQNSDTPFLQETAPGVFAAGTWTATATGVVTPRYYTALILQVGTNWLNAAPNTILNVQGTFPLFNGGLLTVAANPWLLTYENGYDVEFLFYPWTLVTNKPEITLGSYSNANNIVMTVTGIPSASAVNLVVPGSQHPWVVAMRNALV